MQILTREPPSGDHDATPEVQTDVKFEINSYVDVMFRGKYFYTKSEIFPLDPKTLPQLKSLKKEKI